MGGNKKQKTPPKQNKTQKTPPKQKQNTKNASKTKTKHKKKETEEHTENITVKTKKRTHAKGGKLAVF